MSDIEITIALKTLYNVRDAAEQIYWQRCSLVEWESLLNRRKYKRKFQIDQINEFALITLLPSHLGIWHRKY